MVRIFATISLLFLYSIAIAQNRSGTSPGSNAASLSRGTSLLFRDVKTKLTTEERTAFYKRLNLKIAPDNQSFAVDDFPVTVFVYPTDMNKDGTEELFIVLSSTALYSDRGDMMLFIKGTAGTYQYQQSIGGGSPVILSTSSKGYPDILIGGPGFEYPAFRWNGTQYSYWKIVKDQTITNTNSTDIAAYSKAYTATIR